LGAGAFGLRRFFLPRPGNNQRRSPSRGERVKTGETGETREQFFLLPFLSFLLFGSWQECSVSVNAFGLRHFFLPRPATINDVHLHAVNQSKQEKLETTREQFFLLPFLSFLLFGSWQGCSVSVNAVD
jgi:hypothetical protein